MLDSGGTIPDNYKWKITGKSLLCFDYAGHLVMSVPIPSTLRQALLQGYFEGWNYGQSINEGYIELLERICHENGILPQPVTFSESELQQLEAEFEKEPLNPEERAMESFRKTETE